MKDRLQNIKLEGKSIDQYVKEFKEICVGLAAIQKPVDEDTKVITFAKGLGTEYGTFRTVMLGKPPYPTLAQFIIALRGFDIREEKTSDKTNNPSTMDPNMSFNAQRAAYYARGRGRKSRGTGSYGYNFNSKGRGFRPAAQYNPNAVVHQNSRTPQSQPTFFRNNGSQVASQQSQNTSNASTQNQEECQICGYTNHTALTTITVGIFHIKGSHLKP